MTAPPTVSRERSPHVQGSADSLRARLLAEAEIHTATIVSCAAAIGSLTPGRADLGRAMDALRMYGARQSLDEIEAALDRVDGGTYGTCPACHDAIPVEHLEAIPLARFCAACTSPTAPTVEGGPGPRPGQARSEHAGTPPPACSPRTLFDPAHLRPTDAPRGTPIPE